MTKHECSVISRVTPKLYTGKIRKYGSSSWAYYSDNENGEEVVSHKSGKWLATHAQVLLALGWELSSTGNMTRAYGTDADGAELIEIDVSAKGAPVTIVMLLKSWVAVKACVATGPRYRVAVCGGLYRRGGGIRVTIGASKTLTGHEVPEGLNGDYTTKYLHIFMTEGLAVDYFQDGNGRNYQLANLTAPELIGMSVATVEVPTPVVGGGQSAVVGIMPTPTETAAYSIADMISALDRALPGLREEVRTGLNDLHHILHGSDDAAGH